MCAAFRPRRWFCSSMTMRQRRTVTYKESIEEEEKKEEKKEENIKNPKFPSDTTPDEEEIENDKGQRERERGDKKREKRRDFSVCCAS